jgi:hypothetical protein
VWLDRFSTSVGAPSGGASASRIAPAVTVEVGLPPPSSKLVREAPARWFGGGGLR